MKIAVNSKKLVMQPSESFKPSRGLIIKVRHL